MKGFKFRLEPNETQKKQIQETLDSARFVYNRFLDLMKHFRISLPDVQSIQSSRQRSALISFHIVHAIRMAAFRLLISTM